MTPTTAEVRNMRQGEGRAYLAGFKAGLALGAALAGVYDGQPDAPLQVRLAGDKVTVVLDAQTKANP